MRIAVFYNLSFGGAKRVVYEQVKGLVNIGHTIDIYTTDSEEDIFSPHRFSTNTYSYKIPNLNLLNRIEKDFFNFNSLSKVHKKIANDIDSRSYDLVLVHPDKLTQAPYLLRHLKSPSYYYCQEPLRIVYDYSLRFKDKVFIGKKIYEEATRLIRKKIDRENTRSATYTIASCYHVRERMIEAYEVYPYVNYPGIDSNILEPKKVKKKNQVLFIGGRNVVYDGYDLAEKAVSLISKDIRPELVVVSWQKNNKNRLSENELAKLYSESIVTLCVSRFETFGLTPLESMACGTPVIATKVSGHRETVKDLKTGYFVEYDSQQIADTITNFIKNPKKRKEMGENGRNYVVKEWRWNKRIIELEKILTKN